MLEDDGTGQSSAVEEIDVGVSNMRKKVYRQWTLFLQVNQLNVDMCLEQWLLPFTAAALQRILKQTAWNKYALWTAVVMHRLRNIL